VGRRKQLVAGVALVCSLVAAGCGSGGTQGADDPAKLNVVTTVSPLTSIVSSVAGDLAEVRGLVPEGANSHTFEPPPSAARTLSRADVIFVNGLKLEDPTRELAAGNLKAGAEVVELGDRTIRPDQYLYDFSFPREGGKPNPHLWTNPPYAKEYGRIVRDTLSRRDPAQAGHYAENYERFAAKVDELDTAMKAAGATVPKRELLTYHDAYAYFAQHYGWKVIGAIQVSSFEEPTPREVAGLIQQVRQVGVPAIFGSEVFPSPVLARIGSEAGVRYVDKLRDDDLPGKPGDPDHSWLGLMRFDYVTMVESLGGDASALRAVQLTGVADAAVYPQ
jgi:ABC-type Zn uptake system ZnuABC Zn-binding protein ZnuA